MKGIIQKRTTDIKNMIKQNKVYIAILFIQITSLFLILSNMGFGTHDELLQYMNYSNPEWKFSTDFSGRFMPVIGQILLYFQFNAPTFAIYRIFTLIAILLGVGAASLFVKHHISEKDWLKYAIVFLAFLQIVGAHNGAVAFDMTYQYRMFYCFMFLDLYLLFCKTEKTIYYILGTFFWCVAINSYEAYYLFCVVLFIMAVVTLHEKKKLTIKNLVRYLWLPALVSIISVVIYFVKTKLFGQSYDGATLGTSYGMLDKIKSILIYATGNWPLRLNTYTFKEVLAKATVFNFENIFSIIKNVLVAAVICTGAKNEKLHSKGQWGIALAVSAMSAVLIATLVGVTDQYCTWAFDAGPIAGGICYYSYFFIIMVFFLLMNLINKISNRYCLKIIKVLIFVCVFFVCITTDVNNRETSVALDKADNKYELFDAVVKSDYFASIEDGAVIYAPEMIGVHYDMKSLDLYCKHNINKEVTFRNQLSEINFEQNVYMLRYISESDVMVLGNVEDEHLETNEIYVVGMNVFSNYSVCVWRDIEEQVSDITINNKNVGRYGNSISVPLTGIVEGYDILMQGKRLPIEDICFLRGSVTDSAVLRFEFDDGVYGLEGTGRWIAADSYYVVDYKGYETISTTVCLTLSTASGEKGIIEVEVNDEVIQYDVCEVPTTIKIDVALEHGENRININSKVTSLEARDARDLNLRLTEAYGLFEEQTYKFY